MPITARPTDTTPFQEELYAQLAPAWGDQDPENNWALLKFIGAYAAMADQIEGYARDTEDGDPGWSLLVDINRCPNEALPFLGQFVGVDVTNFARITVLDVNIDGDPMGQDVAQTHAFIGTGVIQNLPDGAVPVDNVSTSGTIFNKAFKMTANGAGASSCYHAVAVTPGQLYNVSIDMWVKAGTVAAFPIWDFATGLQIVGLVAPTTTPVADGWLNVNCTFAAPASGVIFIIPSTLGGTSGDHVYYTNWQERIVRPETDDEYYARMRATIQQTGGYYRGSPAALEAAAAQFLTGSKTVIFKERDSGVSAVAGGAYGLTVITYGSETPDRAKVLAALLAQKPAGILLDYEVINGTVWLVLRTVYPTWAAVKAAFVTWNGVRNNIPGT